MKVLKAKIEEYNELNGYRKGNSILLFIKDFHGNWIIGKSVLTDPAFMEIRLKLENLEEIEFKPIDDNELLH